MSNIRGRGVIEITAKGLVPVWVTWTLGRPSTCHRTLNYDRAYHEFAFRV